MYGLLQWLFDRYWDVTDWFANRYSSAIALLSNFWTWLQDRVMYYYNLAKAWAIAKKAEAIAFAASIVQGALSAVQVWVDAAKSWAWGWIENAKGYAWNLVEAAKGYAWGLVNWLEGVGLAARNWLRGQLEGLINSAKTFVMNWARDAVGLVPSVRDLINVLSGTRLGRLVTMVENWWPTLALLVNNPLGFIVGCIKGSFVTLLCFSIAYGLGTVKLTLPPWPIFGGGGTDE